MADSKQNALDMIEAARQVHEQSWLTLGRAAGLIRVRGGDLADNLRLRARASQRVTFYNSMFHEIQAAGTVISAPTVAQIQATRNLIAKVKSVTVADATVKAGLDVIAAAMQEAAANVRTTVQA